jgi:DNA polymerase III delta prime subunit
MHSVREHVSRLDADLASVPYCSAVFFTRVDFALTSPAEWCDWQVVDRRMLALRPLREIVVTILKHARERVEASPSGGWLRTSEREPTAPQADRILRILRPQFEFYESPKSRRQDRQRELKKYTGDQLVALDHMEANDRVLFEGPAGSGKTLLAIEAARRSANGGRRTALICFNRLLGGWLRDSCEGAGERLWVGTLHSLLLNLAGIEPSATPAAAFWSSELPELAMQRVLESSSSRFDTLILDEAQDLLLPGYLDILDLLLAGGLNLGRWRFFGDFATQAIYGSAVADPAGSLADRTGHFARYSLNENCRNTPRIAEAVSLMTGSPRYSRILRPDNGVEPRTIVYRSPEDQIRRLAQALDGLRAEGFGNDEIVILSKNSAGAAEGLPEPWLRLLQPLGASDSRRIRAGTIHAFKGLEAAAVLVTDIDQVGDAADDSLLYVALSRATDRLTVFVDESARQALVARMEGF